MRGLTRILTRNYFHQELLTRCCFSTKSSMDSASILLDVKDSVAVIGLNRPKALNSLNPEMCTSIKRILLEWQSQQESPQRRSNVNAFLMKGMGGKAFCAGGDVKSIYTELVESSSNAKGGPQPATPGSISYDFFKVEYEMNYLLGMSKIPQVSFWDGIVMGGGVGVSVLGAFRVATEKTMFAMPETAIGLFPDVGSSSWLPHIPRGQGLYIGMTGCRLGAADLLHTGIATHFVPSSRLEELEHAIIESKPSSNLAEAKKAIGGILDSFSGRPEESKSLIIPNADSIERCFHEKNSVDDILAALKEESTTRGDASAKWANDTLQLLSKMSPTSLKLTVAQLKEGKSKSLKSCLEMEFRLMMGCMLAPDFREGIRALLVDKDNKPKWAPAASDSQIREYFNHLQHELNLQN